MDELITQALETFRASGSQKVYLDAGRFATVNRTAGYDYVRVYDIRGEALTAKRFRI